MAVRVYFTPRSPSTIESSDSKVPPHMVTIQIPGETYYPVATRDDEQHDTYYIALNDILLDELPFWTHGVRSIVNIVKITVREEVFVPITPGRYSKSYHDKWTVFADVTKSKSGCIVRITSTGYLPCRQLFMDLLSGEIKPTKEYLGTMSKPA